MSLSHWNYFLAVEEDLNGLSRYIEFDNNNYKTYSLELARILMAAVQEIDVLFKQICDLKKTVGNCESDYRREIPKTYPNLPSLDVIFPRYGLQFLPFGSWTKPTSATPLWWTANNKVKHERHNFFHQASLENTLNAAAGLFVANLYFYDASRGIDQLSPGPKYLWAEKACDAITPTEFGNIPNFKVP